MPFDLALAMHKKAEFETARLMAFDFKRRARATRLVARSLALDEAAAIALVGAMNKAASLECLGADAGVSLADLTDRYKTCTATAHEQLVAEDGDPTQHRLA